MTKAIDIQLGPNDQGGYRLTISVNGVAQLQTSKHPITGEDLTAHSALEVAGYYVEAPTCKPSTNDAEWCLRRNGRDWARARKKRRMGPEVMGI